jgi:hypothetical protein
MKRLSLQPIEIAAFVACQAVGLAFIVAGVRSNGFDLISVLFVALVVEVFTLLSIFLFRGLRRLGSRSNRDGA